MNTPKISVITVSFNQGEFIRQNIESVLAQDYPNFEHIVVDGGSTDETVAILKSYPHLKWTSEPDNGQTDALNKGFSRATGDIIAWLNSDDWYPPEVFREIVPALAEYPVVMGACQLTDKQGRPTELVPNPGRSWHDMLKYWVYYSVPSQPSIFFTRAALDSVRRSDGKHLDESLEYTMDYDLWLRLAQKYPLSRHIPKVLSCYRMYESNKTGSEMAAVYREMSRVYARHARQASGTENGMTFVMPIRAIDRDLTVTMEALQRQTLAGFELLLVDYGISRAESRKIKKSIVQAGEHFKAGRLRHLHCESGDAISAFLFGASEACSPLITAIGAGQRPAPDFCLESHQLFQIDGVGLAMPWKTRKELRERFADANGLLNVNALFPAPEIPGVFTVRKLALMDVLSAGSRTLAEPIFFVRELLIRLLYKSWNVSVNNNLDMEFSADLHAPDVQLVQLLNNYVNASLVDSISSEFFGDPFAAIKLMHGFTFNFPEPLCRASRQLLERAPNDWFRLDYRGDLSKLLYVTSQNPEFAPAWKMLAEKYQQVGQADQAAVAAKRFNDCWAVEGRV